MRTITLFFSILICFSIMNFSCKTSKKGNSTCVEVIQNSTFAGNLTESEMYVIKSLFESNRMDFSKYHFYQLDKDDLGFHHVKCFQLINNLKVFSEELIFHFNKNNENYLTSGNVINSLKLDDKQSLNKNKAVEIFLGKITQEKASMVDKNIQKGCFEVEFGYYGLDGSKGKFVKVWKVKPKGKDHPYAYINDDNSEIVYYDNGVRF